MEQPSVVIGIHGLENKPPRDEKRNWWRAALVEGLTRNRGIDGAGLSFEFVYWADLRYESPLTKDANLEPYAADAGEGPFPSPEPEAEQTLSTPLGLVYRGVDQIQTATGATPVDDVILRNRFDDLWHYHQETSFAQEVRRRLCDEIVRHAGSRVLLIAHSMGSLIAYDVLRMLERDAPAVRIDHLATLGSPLGLSEVKMKIASENGATRVPNNVGCWSNMADRRDVATIAGDLAADYGPNDYGTAIRDMSVVNAYLRPGGEPNPHKSYGYLRTPEMSAIAAAFVSSREAPRYADGRARSGEALGGGGAPPQRPSPPASSTKRATASAPVPSLRDAKT